MKPAVFLAIAGGVVGVSNGVMAAPASPPLPELIAPLQMSDPTSYEIEMQTSLVIPADGPQATELRVWQALPTPKPWNGVGDVTSSKYGTAAQDVEFSPATGVREQLIEQQSNHVVWLLKKELEPGTPLRFTTRYTVHSVTRSVDREIAVG